MADYIKPPLGFESDLVSDARLWQPISMLAMQAAVQSLAKDNAIPYTVAIPVIGENASLPIQANAAEFLNGMCTLFTRLRQGDALGTMHVTPSYIVPLSGIPNEAVRQEAAGRRQARLRRNWTGPTISSCGPWNRCL